MARYDRLHGSFGCSKQLLSATPQLAFSYESSFHAQLSIWLVRSLGEMIEVSFLREFAACEPVSSLLILFQHLSQEGHRRGHLLQIHVLAWRLSLCSNPLVLINVFSVADIIHPKASAFQLKKRAISVNRTKFSTVGRCCCAAQDLRAERQLCPAGKLKIFVMRPRSSGCAPRSKKNAIKRRGRPNIYSSRLGRGCRSIQGRRARVRQFAGG